MWDSSLVIEKSLQRNLPISSFIQISLKTHAELNTHINLKEKLAATLAFKKCMSILNTTRGPVAQLVDNSFTFFILNKLQQDYQEHHNNIDAKYIENILIRTSELNFIRQHILAPEVKNIISSIEYWDENCQKLLGDSPESTYFVVVELSSSSKDEIDLCLETLAEKNINIALLNSKQSDEIWAKREDLPVNLASKGAYKMDISVPLETLEIF